LRPYRLAAGLTPAALAGRAGKARTAVSKLERGETDPSWKSAVKLFRALGVRLVFGTGRARK
jgi:transcriptional regulator with XRE-family HTH domain